MLPTRAMYRRHSKEHGCDSRRSCRWHYTCLSLRFRFGLTEDDFRLVRVPQNSQKREPLWISEAECLSVWPSSAGTVMHKNITSHFIRCALGAAQCIVIAPVCLWVCVGGSVTVITRNCVHRSLPNSVCR